jgi:hypothetical protein
MEHVLWVFLCSVLFGLGAAIATFRFYRGKSYPTYKCLITSLLAFVVIGSALQTVGWLALILVVQAR